jgi:hypothetical protein
MLAYIIYIGVNCLLVILLGIAVCLDWIEVEEEWICMFKNILDAVLVI